MVLQSRGVGEAAGSHSGGPQQLAQARKRLSSEKPGEKPEELGSPEEGRLGKMLCERAETALSCTGRSAASWPEQR